MAYRFLLEVPDRLAAEANVAVSAAPDAEVVLARNSHGLGFDDPYTDLTVAAHSLRVIDGLYRWYALLDDPKPAMSIVLHSGDRVALDEVGAGVMVSTIRRDQPWVERTLPKIGEHVVDRLMGDRSEITVDVVAPADVVVGIAEAVRPAQQISLRVNDLQKAEEYYRSNMDMRLIARFRGLPDGTYEDVGPEYSWVEAIRIGRQADVSYVSNGTVLIALQRVGAGRRLESATQEHVRIAVDPETLTEARAEAYVRPVTILSENEQSVVFRDPFGLVWTITTDASPMLSA